MSDSQPVENQNKANDGNFNIWIMCLLGVMLAAVVGLWIVEMGRVKRAYAAIKSRDEYISRQGADMQKIGGMLAENQVKRIDPASLPTEKHKFDGKEVDVILFDEYSAKSHGLKPGDVILVAPEGMGPVAR